MYTRFTSGEAVVLPLFILVTRVQLSCIVTVQKFSCNADINVFSSVMLNIKCNSFTICYKLMNNR